jgi:uncharacterized membrane protein
MIYTAAITLHLLAAIVWIGGMFFAYTCLRPSLPETLEPPQAARVLAASLGRFFSWVWCAVVVLLVSGFYMTLNRYQILAAPWWLNAMMGLGLGMMLLFAHIVFAPFNKLRAAVAAGESDVVGKSIGQIRKIVAANLILGLVIVVVVSIGRHL